MLTSAENRRFLQGKEEKKGKKEAQKEQRKKDNEERKRICSNEGTEETGIVALALRGTTVCVLMWK